MSKSSIPETGFGCTGCFFEVANELNEPTIATFVYYFTQVIYHFKTLCCTNKLDNFLCIKIHFSAPSIINLRTSATIL